MPNNFAKEHFQDHPAFETHLRQPHFARLRDRQDDVPPITAARLHAGYNHLAHRAEDVSVGLSACDKQDPPENLQHLRCGKVGRERSQLLEVSLAEALVGEVPAHVLLDRDDGRRVSLLLVDLLN